jgi:hypothetical protein
VRELSSHKHNFKKLAQFCLVAVLLFRTRNHDTPFLHIHLRLKMHFRGLNNHPVYICTPPIFCRRKDIWWDGAASGEAGAELVKIPCRKPRASIPPARSRLHECGSNRKALSRERSALSWRPLAEVILQ